MGCFQAVSEFGHVDSCDWKLFFYFVIRLRVSLKRLIGQVTQRKSFVFTTLYSVNLVLAKWLVPGSLEVADMHV